MRSELVYTSSGSPVRLGREIGRGGEGVVYEIEGRAEQVAKLYLSPVDSQKTAKLQTMLLKRTDALTRLAAWPSDLLLKAPRGRVAGLLMRRITGFRPIHELYTPKSRLQEFPRANWPFLVHVAANVARAFALMHSCGVIIGDVNHGNILVNDAGITALIDCDSYQVLNNGQKFICEVGVAAYTPPELQGKNFSTVVRTENHDNFGLALLIFHLLFMGRHPFAGRFLGAGEMPVERAIREYRFAFSAHSNAKAQQMAPPPNSLRLADLPATMANLFEQAFSPAAAQAARRPEARQWLDALETLSRELALCSRVSSHHYYKPLPSCPWCHIENNSALMLFLQLDWPSANPDFNLAAVWSQITSISAPGPAPGLITRQDALKHFVPGKAAGRRRRKRLVFALAIIVCAISASFVLKLDPSLGFWTTVAAVCVAVVIAKITTPRRPGRAVLAAKLAASRYQNVQKKWREQTSEKPFADKLAELEAARNEFDSLPRMRHEGMKELEKDRRQTQLQKFLDLRYIRDATLAGIGPGRRAMLASYGIDTAGDVTWQSLENVDGIGSRNAVTLITWRDSLVSQFIFNPRLGVDRSEIARLEHRIAERRSHLEHTLTAGVAELELIRRRILDARTALQAAAQEALMVLLQAEEELQSAKPIIKNPKSKVHRSFPF